MSPKKICALRVLSYSFLYWGLFVFLTRGLIPTSAFFILGITAFTRLFNEVHDLFHINNIPLYLKALTRFFPPTSMVQLHFQELKKAHLGHHQHVQTADDFDDYLIQGNKGKCFVTALFQPEIHFVRYIKRWGFERSLFLCLLFNVLLLGGIYGIAGASAFITYLAVTRLGNALCWFLFSALLHTDHAYGPVVATYPAWFENFVKIVLGRRILNAVKHHRLHHRFPGISSLRLPNLAARGI